MQAQAAIATGGASPAIALCDHKGCKEPAKFSYTWEWGESGKCCGTHQFVLNQTAGNISRQIQFQPLDSGIAPPIQRDERIAFNARVLTLEAELAEGQTRGLELYNQNVQLTQQVQALTVGKRELEAQIVNAGTENAALRQELEARTAQVGELGDEAGRLRVLVQRPPASVQELEARLKSATSELEATQRKLAAAGELESKLAAATAELTQLRAELQTVGGGEDPPKGKSKNPAK